MESQMIRSDDDALDIRRFNQLFEELKPRFIRFASGYVADATAVEDIVMESFMAAWERHETLSVSEFAPYTLTVVKNRCLNWLRAQQVRQRAAEDLHSHGARLLRARISTLQACDPEELFSDEARRLVARTLDGMPARTRDVFVRSRYRGQSYKQIASEMGLTIKSVEFEISKAMKLLRVALKDYLPFLAFWFYIS